MQPARLTGHAELAQLGQENHDSETIDEAQHHRVRHHADKLAQFEGSGRYLQNTHQHHCGKQVLHAVIRHQGDHHHRQGACRPRNHTGAPANTRGDQPDHKGRIKTDQGLHARDKGKGDRLWHQCQGHRQARQHVILYSGNFTGVKFKHLALTKAYRASPPRADRLPDQIDGPIGGAFLLCDERKGRAF